MLQAKDLPTSLAWQLPPAAAEGELAIKPIKTAEHTAITNRPADLHIVPILPAHRYRTATSMRQSNQAGEG